MVLKVNGPWLLGMGTGLNHRHTVGAVGTVQAVGSPPQAPPEGQREISVIAPKGTVSQCPIPLGIHVDEKASTPGLMHNTEFHYIAHLFKTDPDPGHAAALDKVIGGSGVILISAGEDSQTLVALRSAKEWRESQHSGTRGESSFNRWKWKADSTCQVHV